MMTEFLEYYKEHWYYILILVAAVVLFVFAVKRARKSYRDYYRRYRKEEAQIERLKSLKERFSSITSDELLAENDGDVLEGIALTYQLALQKNDNMEKAFAAYPAEKQYVYALDIFVQSEKSSAFFRENGRELTDIIVPAFEYFEMPGEAAEAEKLRIMFDDRDETTSVNSQTINAVDEHFASEGRIEGIKLNVAAKIKAEPKKFILN